MTHKICSTCQQRLPVEQFYVQKLANGKTYTRGDCRFCKREKHKAWSKTSHGRVVKRNGILAREFGLSANDYARMLAEQGGVCAICGAPPTEGRRLHIDHCHDSGKVRALLCSKCNTFLGLADDDPERMRAAANYVEMHRGTCRG